MSNKTTLPCHKVPGIMRAKAEKAPMCSISLIAIELKGLAAPHEALKNNFWMLSWRKRSQLRLELPHKL